MKMRWHFIMIFMTNPYALVWYMVCFNVMNSYRQYMTSYGRDGVSSHLCIDCSLNRLFRRRSKNTSKLRIMPSVRGIHLWSVVSPDKGPVTRIMLPCDDIIMKRTNRCWYHFLQNNNCNINTIRSLYKMGPYPHPVGLLPFSTNMVLITSSYGWDAHNGIWQQEWFFGEGNMYPFSRTVTAVLRPGSPYMVWQMYTIGWKASLQCV